MRTLTASRTGRRGVYAKSLTESTVAPRCAPALAAGGGPSAGTTINGGALQVGATGTTGALGATTAVTVNSSGTLLLNGDTGTNVTQAVNTQVNDSATVTVNDEGTLSMQGLAYARENLGSLTLTGDSIIDFGALDGNTLSFSSLVFGGGFTSLRINNWSWSNFIPGASNDPGFSSDANQDRLVFVGQPDLGTNNNWANISFYDNNGTFLGNARQISFEGGFELVPVPEPTTILGGQALVGLIGYRERRRLGSLARHFKKKQVV